MCRFLETREREREWEREKQGETATGRERKKQERREKECERDVEYVQNCLFLKGITGALAPFSYLVNIIITHAD
jgi:hypothetical protein